MSTKTAVKTTTKAKSTNNVSIFLEIGEKQIDVTEVQKRVLEDAKSRELNAKNVDIYFVASECAAYYVADGESSAEYKVVF